MGLSRSDVLSTLFSPTSCFVSTTSPVRVFTEVTPAVGVGVGVGVGLGLGLSNPFTFKMENPFKSKSPFITLVGSEPPSLPSFPFKACSIFSNSALTGEREPTSSLRTYSLILDLKLLFNILFNCSWLF